MKRIIVLVFVCVLFLSLVACGADDLVGTWVLNDDEALTIKKIVFDEDTIEFYDVSMTYKVKGKKITVEFMEGKSSEWEFSVKDDILTLTIDGTPLEYIRVE